jgi:hypothetical protein
MTTVTVIVGCGGAGEVEREIALLAAHPVVCIDVLLGLGRVATDHVGGAFPAVPLPQVCVHAQESGCELLQCPFHLATPSMSSACMTVTTKQLPFVESGILANSWHFR